MGDEGAIRAFIDGYRRTFETFDVDAITACFAFPLQVVGDGDPVAPVAIPDREAWQPQIERIVGAYRLIGVRRAEVRALRVVPATPHVAHAIVGWSLRDAAGAVIYDFDASYTVATAAGGWRIVGIVHDETPKLQLAVARAQAGRAA